MYMNRTILQVPMQKSLRDLATKAATNQGFSSLQEAIRIFLTSMAQGKHKITFHPEPTQLSSKAIRRYDKIMDDIKSGKVKTKGFTNVDDMMEYLNA